MNASSKKLKARDEFIHFAENLTKGKFGKLNAVQQSFAFTHFYIKEIRNRIRAEISDEDLELAIVDGGGDLDCDLVHRDDRQVLIVQTRYRGHGTTEPADKISHFQAVLKRLADPNLKANSRLREQIASIDWKNDSFELVYVTFGNIDNSARKIAEQKPSYPNNIADLDQRCSWSFLDETNLNEELRGALALTGEISDQPLTLYPLGQKGKKGAASVIEVTAGDHRSLILALDARQIIRAYQALRRDALFSLNIRNYIGNTSTNKAIIRSAQTVPDQFFLFNNGISCLCTKMEIHEDRLEVRGLQVINGAQTVKALVRTGAHRPGEPDPWSSSVPRVLVRITEIPGGYGASGKVRDQITQFNNTQNTIKDSDFRSNDSVQQHLKEQFSKIWRRGRQVAYMPKRTDIVPKNAETVRLEEFAKSVYAFLSDPTSFSGATAFLFNDDATGGYNLIFGDGESKWEKMPEAEFRVRAAIYWLAQEFGAHMKQDRANEVDPDSRAALERKWMLLFAVRKVFEHYFPDDAWKQELQKLYKGDWELGAEAKGELLLRIYRDAKAGLTTAYKTSKKYDPAFVHRNWMRSKNTPSQISDTLNTLVLVNRDPIDSIPA